jgi:hypothetical protein
MTCIKGQVYYNINNTVSPLTNSNIGRYSSHAAAENVQQLHGPSRLVYT